MRDYTDLINQYTQWQKEVYDQERVSLDKKYNFLRWLVITSLAFISIFSGVFDVDKEVEFSKYLYVSIIVDGSLAIILTGFLLHGEGKRINALLTVYFVGLSNIQNQKWEVNKLRVEYEYAWVENIVYVLYLILLICFSTYLVLKAL